MTLQQQRWKRPSKLDRVAYRNQVVPDQQQGSIVMAISSAKKPGAKPAAKPIAKAAPKAAITAPKAPAPQVPAPKALVPDTASTAPEAVILETITSENIDKAARIAAPQVKKKELIARVVAALDGKKKGGVKEIVEATLETLGAALQKGESLNLPPLGHARVARQKGEGTSSLTTVRLRGAGMKNAPKGGKQTLAEPGEDD